MLLEAIAQHKNVDVTQTYLGQRFTQNINERFGANIDISSLHVFDYKKNCSMQSDAFGFQLIIRPPFDRAFAFVVYNKGTLLCLELQIIFFGITKGLVTFLAWLHK